LQTPTGYPAVQLRAKHANPGAKGVAKKTWDNICANVRAALELYGTQRRTALPKELTPEWHALYGLLTDKSLMLRLRAFVYWCSAQGIHPEQVNDIVADRWRKELVLRSIKKDPDRRFRETCTVWNRAADKVAGWPKQRLAVPSFRQLISFPWPDFPASLQQDVGRYLEFMSGKDVLDEHLDYPRDASTIENHRRQIQRLASAIVRSGVPINELLGLAELARPDRVEAGLRFYLDRLGGKRPSLFEIASTIVVMAKLYLRTPEAQLKELRRLRDKLKCRTRGRMTDKNRERLRPLLDRRNQARFLSVGDKLLIEAKKQKSGHKAALRIQTALMHEIIIAAPMRLENLVSLNLNRHFLFSLPGKAAKTHISIPAAEVKNREPLDFDLPPRVVELLNYYLKVSRLICVGAVDDGWLFPGAVSGHKNAVSLRAQLMAAVLKHSGLVVNPHLYRHIAAYFYLQAHPGDYETVRRVLGHKSAETTKAFYVEFESYAATAMYTSTILQKRAELRGLEA
jgi:integrase